MEKTKGDRKNQVNKEKMPRDDSDNQRNKGRDERLESQR